MICAAAIQIQTLMPFVLDTFLTKPQEPAQKAKLQIDPLRNEKYFLGVRHTPQNYFVFILMTKSKWYFAIPTLLLLVIDQGLKYQATYLKKQKKSYEILDTIRGYIDYALIALIVLGFISYGIRQKNTFGNKFSFIKLLFSNKCRL